MKLFPFTNKITIWSCLRQLADVECFQYYCHTCNSSALQISFEFYQTSWRVHLLINYHAITSNLKLLSLNVHLRNIWWKNIEYIEKWNYWKKMKQIFQLLRFMGYQYPSIMWPSKVPLLQAGFKIIPKQLSRIPYFLSVMPACDKAFSLFKQGII